ncbi:hypothetical protein CHS0354_000747 [Potamilus streckersoni]|uniref:thiazole synthase n=1 Tax=Potamilus streckersoni TaxID=2493646 RepID=A0AAE0T7I0_9BIVA|nr:hypothetical protein CHS0354_000747 [Potamilus streckersoni]
MGTSRYPNVSIMMDSLRASETEIVTLAVRRLDLSKYSNILEWVGKDYFLLPNTAGCYTAREAVLTAELAREALETNWIKLEVIGDQDSLFPDCVELLKAAETLIEKRFIVLPYTNDDPIVAKRLYDLGCAAVMPLGSPIGSGMGIRNPFNIRMIRETLPSDFPMIIDAGIGTASDAALAMELGADGVLLNTAVSLAQNPVQMATAMKYAVEAGRLAFLSGRIPQKQYANASSPIEGTIKIDGLFTFFSPNSNSALENWIGNNNVSYPTATLNSERDINDGGAYINLVDITITFQNESWVKNNLLPKDTVGLILNLGNTLTEVQKTQIINNFKYYTSSLIPSRTVDVMMSLSGLDNHSAPIFFYDLVKEQETTLTVSHLQGVKLRKNHTYSVWSSSLLVGTKLYTPNYTSTNKFITTAISTTNNNIALSFSSSTLNTFSVTLRVSGLGSNKSISAELARADEIFTPGNLSQTLPLTGDGSFIFSNVIEGTYSLLIKNYFEESSKMVFIPSHASVIKVSTQPVSTNVTFSSKPYKEFNIPGCPKYLSMGTVTSGDISHDPGFHAAPVDAIFKYAGNDGAGDRGTVLEAIITEKTILQSRRLEAYYQANGYPNHKVMPVMVFYTANASGSSSEAMKDVRNVDTLRMHYQNAIKEIKMALSYKDATHPYPATYLLSPDLLGGIQQHSKEYVEPGTITIMNATLPINTALRAAYTAEGLAIPSNLPNFENNLKGYFQSVNYLFTVFGENSIPFGWQENLWSVGSSTWNHKLDDAEIVATTAIEVADFVKALGVYSGKWAPTYIAFDKYERDDFGFESKAAYAYNATNWERYLVYCDTIAKLLGKPAMLWQIPGGHLPAKNEINKEYDIILHSGSSATFFFGDRNIGKNLNNIKPEVLSISLNPSMYMGATSVRQWLEKDKGYNWSKSRLQEVANRGFFSILWGGGSTTSIATIKVNGYDDGWLANKVTTYHKEGKIYSLNFVQEESNTSSFDEGKESQKIIHTTVQSIFPNPASNQINIRFSVKETEDIKIEISDLLGRTVQRVDNQLMQRGIHNISLQVNHLPSGVYIKEAIMQETWLNEFVGQYKLQKTLRFELRPVGKTEAKIKDKGFLCNDKTRDKHYQEVKELVDDLHRKFIDCALKQVSMDWKELAEAHEDLRKAKLDNKKNRTEDERKPQKKSDSKTLKALEERKRKAIYDNFVEKAKSFFDSILNRVENKSVEDDESKNRAKKSKKPFDKKFDSFFKEGIFSEILVPMYEKDKEKKEWLTTFEKFSAYFLGFHENRRNVYSDGDEATAVPHRIVNVNFPKFLNNLNLLKSLYGKEFGEVTFLDWIKSESNLGEINIDKFDAKLLENKTILECIQFVETNFLKLDFYNQCLTQEGIDTYNEFLGVLNLVLNIFRQKNNLSKKDAPNLAPLYKQILSLKGKGRKFGDQFPDDFALREGVTEFYLTMITSFENTVKEKVNTMEKLAELLKYIETHPDGVIVRNDCMTDLSTKIFGEWAFIDFALGYASENKFPADAKGKISKTTEKNRERFMKSDFSIAELNKIIVDYVNTLEKEKGNDKEKDNRNEVFKNEKRQFLVNSENPIRDYFLNKKTIEVFPQTNEKAAVCIDSFFDMQTQIPNLYSEFEKALQNVKEKDENLFKEDASISDKVKHIKAFLDELMAMVHFLKPISKRKRKNDSDEESYDAGFYNDFDQYYGAVCEVNDVYNQARNYISRKPYKEEKYKLNFENPTLGNGWDKNKEEENTCVILRRNGTYFLAIMDKKNNTIFRDENIAETGTDFYEKVEYKQFKAGTDIQNLILVDNKYTRFTKNLDTLKEKYIPQIAEIKKKGSYSQDNSKSEIKKFNRDDLNTYINYYKKAAQGYWHWIQFNFKETSEYKNWLEFTIHLTEQGYKIWFSKVPVSYIDECVSNGKLFLFKIHNKDFSPHARGAKNLHTLYWEQVFSAENLKDVVYKLNGEAELFFRPNSIEKEKVFKHKTGEWVAKKINPQTETSFTEEERREFEKNKSTEFARKLEYDIIKDKRFTNDKYLFHVPITINFKARGNDNLNFEVQDFLRNNSDVNILGIDRGEKNLLYCSVINQKGKILEQKSLNVINRDYHALLDARETERKESRLNWQKIGSIKDLKKGYLSLAVHEVTKLILEYNAIVVMEDLNMGMIQRRQKVEKQVYQNFEKMLIEKLNCLVDKSIPANEPGGVLKPLQLTSKFESFQKLGKQSGIIFYVPPQYTSKVDFATGFAPFAYFKHETVNGSKKIIEDAFQFEEYSNDRLRFTIDHSELSLKQTPPIPIWKLEVAQGQKRSEFIPKERKSIECDVFVKLKELFSEYGITTSDDVKQSILTKADGKFFTILFKYLNIISQMRFQIDDEDFILSPVADEKGNYFRTDLNATDKPKDSDANGAYHIALKGLMVKKKIDASEPKKNLDLNIKNEEWFEFIRNKVKHLD